MISIQKDRKPTPSEKRKELRKEKSRAAARCRRGRESEVFDDMLAVLPMPAGCREQLDKASVVRLAINYVKLREFMRDAYVGDCASDGAASIRTFDVNSFSHFLLLLSDAGEIVYVTENISKVLGLSQFDLFGNSVYDFVHPCDHDDVRAALHDKESAACVLFSRMKCTLLPKGRAVHIKSASYKVVKFTGQAYRRRGGRKSDATQVTAQCHLLLTGELIPNPADGEVVMDESMCMTHHSLDMKITYYDGNVIDKLGYEPSALLGTSLYDYVHASDAKPMEKLFKTLYSKGQIATECYRLLVGGGGYVWVVTQATVVLSKKTSAPKQIVCIHTVLSDVEEMNVVYAEVQRTGLAARPALDAASAVEPSKGVAVNAGTAAVDYSDTGIIDATEALFSDLNCDSVELPSADEPKSDIFAATVSLFKDFDDDDDWLAVGGSGLAGSAELFDDDDDDRESLRPMTPVDLSEGLLVDTTGLDASLDASLDEELDMCMRAPYIPMCPSSDEIFAGTKVLGGATASFITPAITSLLTGGMQQQQQQQQRQRAAVLLQPPQLSGVLRPQSLLPTPPSRPGLQGTGAHLQACSGSATGRGSFVAAGVADSPPQGCSGSCSPTLPSPMMDARETAAASCTDAMQALWAQLTHLLSYGEAPTDAALMAAAKSVNGRVAGVDGERGGARAYEGDAARKRSRASSGPLSKHEPPEHELLAGDGVWLDDAAASADSSLLAASCTQEKARLSLKRSLPQHVISATSPAKKSLVSPHDETKQWFAVGASSKMAASMNNPTVVTCPSEVEEGKRSLLLRLLLHGHDGRDLVGKVDGRSNVGGDWLGVV